jgi:hypothetical protein
MSAFVERPTLSRQDSKGGIDSRFCCNICLEAVAEPVVTQCGHLYCWPCLYRWLEPGMYPDERAALGLSSHLDVPVDSSRRVCPVCKAPSSVPAVVPIYVRAAHDQTPQKIDSDDALAERQDSDADSEELEEPEASDSQMETEFVASDNLGIRQRLRFRSRDSYIPDNEVPSRPAANSPQESPRASPAQQQQQQQLQASSPPIPYRNNTNPEWRTPFSPTAHPASLSQGLLLSFQQQAQQQHSTVPPLHHGIHRTNNETDWEVQPPDATEYLSRLLLMLGSFVMLCLLCL